MSLRDQLASKRTHTTSVTFPLGEAGEKAAQEFADAKKRLDVLKFANSRRKPGEEKLDPATAEAELAEARAAYEAASLTLHFRGLTATERDRLASDHSPVEDGGDVDVRAYTCDLLELAAIDSDLTAEEWGAELFDSGRWSAGEVDEIRETARAAYQEVAAPAIPKD